MRVLICGGRDFSDTALMSKTMLNVMESIGGKPTLVISGYARGADKLGELWARALGIPVKAYPAQWDLYGKAAGYMRNQQMLDEGKPDPVVAFPGGRGTADMVQRAKLMGVRVIEVKHA